MAAVTSVPNLGFYRLKPNTRLAQPSSSGSTSLVFTKPILDETGVAVTKPVILTVQAAQGSYVEFYIAAGGFSDSTHATATARGIVNSGIDLVATDSTLDVDLPTSSKVIGVVSAMHLSIILAALRGTIGTGGTSFRIGDSTASNMTLYVLDSGGTMGLIRRDRTNNKAQYSNDGSTWVNIDTAAPANVTVRSTTNSSANTGEIYQDSSASNSLAYKDPGGTQRKLFNASTGTIPVASLQQLYAADAQANDTYVVTFSPAITSYQAGVPLFFKPNTSNTGACTLNANTLGALAIKKYVSGVQVDLETGDLIANSTAVVVPNFNSSVLILISPAQSDISAANKATLINGSNADSLHIHGYSKRVLSFNSQVVISNTATETTLITGTIPGNSLGANGILEFKIMCSQLVLNTGSSETVTILVKYGGTTVSTITLAGSAITAKVGHIEGYIMNAGATNSQLAYASYVIDPTDNTFGGATAPATNGTAAQDSTADKTFAVTCQFSTASANANATFKHGFVKTTFSS